MIHERIKSVSYAIRDLVVLARELEKRGHRVLKLNIGDPDKYGFDTPDYIKDAMIAAVKEGHSYYADSEGILEVKEAVAKREKRLKDVEVETNNVLPTSGVSEGINMLLSSIVGENDEILMPGPSYPLYISVTKFYGGKPIEYRTIEEEGWRPDVNDIENKITERTRAIVVINPNNPTGAVYPKETLKKITDLAVERDILVMADEVYDMLTFDKEFVSIATLNHDAKYIIFGGLSKVYLAPGWRAGYMIFKGNELEELKEACFRLARARLSTNTPSQIAMKTAMESEPHLEETNREFKKRRDYAVKRIDEIDGLSVLKPEGAMYMFPKIEREDLQDDKKFVLDLLHKKYVLCVHGSGFGKEYGSGHFRIVFLPDLEIQEKAFDRIEEFMKESAK